MPSPMPAGESSGKETGSGVNRALSSPSWPLHWGNWGGTLHQGQTQNMQHVYVQAPGAKTLGPAGQAVSPDGKTRLTNMHSG